MHSFLFRICICVAFLVSFYSTRIAFSQFAPSDSTSGDKIVIIAHKNVPEDALTAAQISELYALESTTWSDGSLVYLFDLKKNSAQKKAFYHFINTNSRELRQRWMQAVLSGEVQSPKITKSLREMVDKVGDKEGAIGYTLASTVTDQVKIIATVN